MNLRNFVHSTIVNTETVPLGVTGSCAARRSPEINQESGAIRSFGRVVGKIYSNAVEGDWFGQR